MPEKAAGLSWAWGPRWQRRANEATHRGKTFVQVIRDREILIKYVDGVHRGTGRWTLEKVADGTRACYQIDLEPHGWFPRLLSNFMDFGKMHSRSMEELFDGLEDWLSRVVWP
jgi:hypothetical protein